MASIDTIGPDGKRLPAGSKAPKGAKYQARWRAPDGASRKQMFDRKVDAEQHLARMQVNMATGEYVDSLAGRMTFREYSEGWLGRKRQVLKRTTTDTFESQLNRHLLPAFGDQQLRALTREQVKAWASTLTVAEFDAAGKVKRKALAQTTARAVVFTLAAILREAVDDGRIVRNPAERVKVGAKTERRVDPMHIALVSGKVSTLADGMPERWRAAVLLMASTGLRLGECLGLTVDRVDFLRRSIRVDRQMVNVKGSIGFGTPKTRAGVRTIPVPSHVTDLLAAHLAQHPAGDRGLIFTMPDGRPVTRNRWADAFRVACETASAGRVRTHDLRHVAASSLIAEGLSVAAVQAVLGHSSPAETLEVYTHLWPTDEDRTRRAIEAASAGWIVAQ